MNTRKLIALALVLGLLIPAAAAAAPVKVANSSEELATFASLSGPCAPGATYDPACDVNHDGAVNVLDVQLAAGHWNQTGTWTGGDGWSLLGNAGTTPGVNVLGTTDNVPLTVVVNNNPALRIEPASDATYGFSPNLIGGYAGNAVAPGVAGATIGGGGSGASLCGPTSDAPCINQAGAAFATVSGGRFNTAGGSYATVGGGAANTASDSYATVGGGATNTASVIRATVGGGAGNTASGANSTISGGRDNTASGPDSTVGGGYDNTAGQYRATVSGGQGNTANSFDATVAGGLGNTASGEQATVAGGAGNTASGAQSVAAGGSGNTASGAHSFAAGRRAKATHNGAFVWADSTDADFSSGAVNSFYVRATGGALFKANNGTYGMSVDNDGTGDGIRAYASTSNGDVWAALYAFNSGTSPGVYASSGGTYAGYFADDIFVAGNCTGCLLAQVAVNSGPDVLAPGDLLAADGVTAALTGTDLPVLRVQRAEAGRAAGVIGVVQGRAVLEESSKDGETLQSAVDAEGVIQPGDHLFIVIYGVAQVRVDAAGGSIPAGQRLTLSDAAGQARAMQTRAVEGMVVSEGAPSIGTTLESSDGKDLVWVLVNPQ